MTTHDQQRPARPLTTTDRAPSVLRLLALLATALLVMAACGSSDDDSSADSGGEVAEAFDDEEAAEFESEGDFGGDDGDFDLAAEEPAVAEEEIADDAIDAPEAADGDGESTLGSGGVPITPTAADIGRKLIFTAEVTVGVDDVTAASAEAAEIIDGLGGFLFGQDTIGGAEPRSVLTFKVLPDDFNQALEQLGTVGELRNQVVTTDDVTERIVDLEGRIQVAELGVDRLRAALEGSESLEDYAELERLLLDRESDLEVMRGQLRTLQDRVDLATITLILTQDRVENALAVTTSIYEAHDSGESCPGREGGSVEAGAPVTVCFDIVNIGDQTLTDISITDSVLEIDENTQLIEVFGSSESLAPGQSLLVAHELTPERTLRLRTRVTAVPVAEEGGEQAGPAVSTRTEFQLRAFEPERDPGFGDGFSAAVAILRGLWIGAQVVVGFLIPLLVLLPFLWLAWLGLRAIRRRRPPKPESPAAPAGWTPPPPPGSTPPPPPAAPAAPPADAPVEEQTSS
ncbi:MAG: DUF4349 domain-containing protein [Actinomycetota bacterium]